MLLTYCKNSIRKLAKTPGFTLTALAMLVLGIGATAAVFSIVEGVLLRPLPFKNPQQLVEVTDKLKGADLGGNGDEAGVTGPDILAYTRDTHSFLAFGGYQNANYELAGAAEPKQINAARLSYGVLPTLGVPPMLGRFFTKREDEGTEAVTVLSYGLWADTFHRDPNILGTKVLLDRKPYLVIGVMPRNFEFPLNPGHLNRSELWVPMSLSHEELTTGAASWNFQTVARLKPGITAAEAQQDANRVAQDIMRNYPAFMTSLHIEPRIHGLQEATVKQVRPLIRILFLAVIVVLLIVCANLAGLLLVRALRYRHENAVRLALGAQAGQILAQTLAESLVLSVVGGCIGVALAAALIRISLRVLPETLPLIDQIKLDWTVGAFAFGLAVLTGLLCGLAPAFAALHTNTNELLKEGGRTGTVGGGHARLRSGLVIAEIAIALVLLAASGLLLRSFEKMRAIDPGFRPDHALTATYSLPRQKYSTQTAVNVFNDELLRRLRELPGVTAAGMTSFLPMAGNTNNTAFMVENYVPPKGANMNLAGTSFVVGDFFRALGIHLLRGRLFNDGDKNGAQLVVIVNRKLAQHYWPGQDPIGKRIRIGMPETPTPWMTIVGEVADVKQASRDVGTQEQYYQPALQTTASVGSLASPTDLAGNGGFIAIRTAVPPQAAENELRTVVRSLDPQLALDQIQTMEHAMSDSEAPRRFNTTLISSFAGIALLLAVLGIYSVMAFSVALRTQEVAIRVALGSQRSGIYRLILSSGLQLAAIGAAVGLIGVYAMAGLVKSFLFEVHVLDPLIIIASVLAIFLFAVLACLLPARRAATTEAMQALRAN
jgi:putative ABC transport system permease protein